MVDHPTTTRPTVAIVAEDRNGALARTESGQLIYLGRGHLPHAELLIGFADTFEHCGLTADERDGTKAGDAYRDCADQLRRAAQQITEECNNAL